MPSFTRLKVHILTVIGLSILACGLWVNLSPILVSGQEETPAERPTVSIIGRVTDTQGVPVHTAEILVYIDNEDEPAIRIVSHEDGAFVTELPRTPVVALRLQVSRPHFESYTQDFDADLLARLHDGVNVRLPDIMLKREITLGFWVATLVFAGILIVMAAEKLHNTTATFLGAAAILGFSHVGTLAFGEQAFIFTFEEAISYIDFEVILLVMSMMVVVGILENTGIFQWMAFMAYRLSRGRIGLLVVILLAITAMASALLDNVTTMLLIAPISLQIALALGINPLSLLLPEVFAANVGGLSTLIGTPTNILIGSFASMSFNDFLVNLTPGVILALVALNLYVQRYYRTEYSQVDQGISPALYARLEENAKIKDPVKLRKGLIVFAVMLLFFLFGDTFGLVPVVTAMIGAAVFLVWVETDVEAMLRTVDWTTLVFFMALFIAVGAIREVGLISILADALAGVIGDNLLLGLLILTWAPAFISLVIDDIPVTAAMLPVVGYLSAALDPSGTHVLFYGFAIGAAMGGNGSLIGAAPNLVAAGIAERAGFSMTYRGFMRAGLPSMLLTITVGLLWLIFAFFIAGPL